MDEREGYIAKRKEKKISLEDIAYNIGCSRSLLSKHENNLTSMSPIKIRKYKEYIDNK